MRALSAGLCALLLAASLPAPAQTAWAYHAWWTPDAWKNAPLRELERVLFFEIAVNAEGALADNNGWPDNFRELRATLRREAIPLDLTLTLFDAGAFERLFSSPEATARLLQQCIQLAAHADVAGLQIDFEVYDPVKPEVLSAFRTFAGNLAARLSEMQPPRALSAFVPVGGASMLYDAASVKAMHRVVMQGYDAHWTGSAHAGPVAPLSGPEAVTWEKALELAGSLGLRPEQVLFSFPFYGYEWPVKQGDTRAATSGTANHVSFAPLPPDLVPAIRSSVQERVTQYGMRHDAQSASGSYRFQREDGQHVEGWFEDWWSLERKTAFVRRTGSAGLAFFVLGYDNHSLLHAYLHERARHAALRAAAALNLEPVAAPAGENAAVPAPTKND